MAWKGSGTTVSTTASDTALTVISRANTGASKNASITNTSANAGHYSLDGGTTWGYLPANYEKIALGVVYIEDVRVKRIPSGSNITAFAEVW